ncbi:MAG: nuclear transport factor 2 family protein [Polyangiales bacterium]
MFDPYAFAQDWVEAWTRRDVDLVLSHYADDAIFTSPKAHTIVGTARLTNKSALEAYWREAVRRIPTIRFELGTASWDEARRTLTVVYTADLAGTKTRACEIMRFDDRGTIVEGEAFYGAPIS